MRLLFLVMLLSGCVEYSVESSWGRTVDSSEYSCVKDRYFVPAILDTTLVICADVKECNDYCERMRKDPK